MVQTFEDPPAPRINAFITVPLTAAQLDSFKNDFEIGACLRYINPMLELDLRQAPPEYLGGKSHAYIRKCETAAGRTGPFLLLDDRVISDDPEKRGVWYVSDFALPDDVESSFVTSQNVVMEILIKVQQVALSHVNYDIGNMSVGEDLSNVEMEDFPPISDVARQQVTAYDSGVDMSTDQGFNSDTCVIASPDEYEETTDLENLKRFSPKPEKLVKLKDSVCAANNLKPGRWAWPNTARPRKMPDGSTVDYPAGTLSISCSVDLTKVAHKYDWPEPPPIDYVFVEEGDKKEGGTTPSAGNGPETNAVKVRRSEPENAPSISSGEDAARSENVESSEKHGS